MKVSIIICTRNRADSLRATLASIGKATVPPSWSVELLVADNGSEDHTRMVVDEARLTNPAVRYISEPRAGQCYARNTGLEESKGDVILFTDDDVRVPLNWVSGMCNPIFKGTADAVAGGVIFPPAIAERLSSPPLSSLTSWFASTEELNERFPTRMVGANMAFHRRVLEKVPRFDVELGPGALGFGDDTLFSRQLPHAGFRLTGALDVEIEHHFDISRLTADRLRLLARNMGRSRAYIFHHWERQRSRMGVAHLLLCKIKRFFSGDTSPNAVESVSMKMLKLERDFGFYSEYIVQRRQEFKYQFHGLQKIA